MASGRRERTEHTTHLPVAVHAAATATEERTILSAPCALRVRAVTITSDIAVTGDNTNTTNLALRNKGAAGVGTTSVGAKAFPTGTNAIAFDENDIPLTAPFTMAEGDTLNLEFVKVGTGVAIGPGLVAIDWEPL
jgi:hypothetical protein